MTASPVGSGLRRSSKGDRTRQRVLDAAAKLFARDGVAAVSMADVGAEIGMKAGSLYFYFSGKDELVDKVLERGIGQALEHVSRAVAAHDAAGSSPAERLRAAIEGHVGALHELSDYSRVIVRSAADRRGRGPDPYLPQERRYASYWVELLQAAQAAGVLPPEQDPRLVRDLLFGAMNATPMQPRRAAAIAGTLASLLGLPAGPR